MKNMETISVNGYVGYKVATIEGKTVLQNAINEIKVVAKSYCKYSNRMIVFITWKIWAKLIT